MAKEFDPTEKSAEEVKAYLEKADKEERDRVVAAERSGKRRKTVLEAGGVDPNERTDRQGRPLYEWELEPGEHLVVAEPAEVDEAEAEEAEQVAGASPQGGTTPAGSGSAAGGVAGTGAGTVAPGTTAGTTAAGAPTTGGTTV